MPKPPNIVVTFADDQRGMALGCAGVEPVQTPHLDALARRGVRCDQAYHYGSCHGAVCAPSRAMFHTGRRYMQLHPGLYVLSPDKWPDNSPVQVPPTLGGKLRAAGYRSFATGKWHNGVESFQASFDSAATVFFGGMADHWFTPVQDYDPSGAYPESRARTADGFSTDVFARSAVDFIRSRKGADQPFFCYCAFTAPHDPRTPPDDFRRLYDPRAIAMPPNFQRRHPFETGELGGRDEDLLGHPRDPREIQHSTAEYYGMISHMDAAIGRIHAALAEIGELENTLVVHTGDHGLAVGQHGLMGKQNIYEHSIRVPLIAAGLTLPAGQVRTGMCYQHDLHPTLLELAGLPAGEVYFQSLAPLLKGDGPGRDRIVCHYKQSQRSVRDRRYKLIEYRVGEVRHDQLFDLQADPWETHDLYEDPAHRDRCAQLAAQLPTDHLRSFE
ncbi:MAG: sulfatase-like hydrolase/transferase [Planctomycetota bacterium]